MDGSESCSSLAGQQTKDKNKKDKNKKERKAAANSSIDDIDDNYGDDARNNLSLAESMMSLQEDMDNWQDELEKLKELSTSLTDMMSLMEEQERMIKERMMGPPEKGERSGTLSNSGKK